MWLTNPSGPSNKCVTRRYFRLTYHWIPFRIPLRIPSNQPKAWMTLTLDHLGFAAAACTTGAFIPQVLMVWRERGAPGISIGMYVLFMLGVGLWLAYGLAIDAWPVIIANGVTLLLAGAVLGMKLVFERPQTT